MQGKTRRRWNKNLPWMWPGPMNLFGRVSGSMSDKTWLRQLQEEERRRQAAIRQASETIKDAKQRIHTAIEVAEESTTAVVATDMAASGRDVCLQEFPNQGAAPLL